MSDNQPKPIQIRLRLLAAVLALAAGATAILIAALYLKRSAHMSTRNRVFLDGEGGPL